MTGPLIKRYHFYQYHGIAKGCDHLIKAYKKFRYNYCTSNAIYCFLHTNFPSQFCIGTAFFDHFWILNPIALHTVTFSHVTKQFFKPTFWADLVQCCLFFHHFGPFWDQFNIFQVKNFSFRSKKFGALWPKINATWPVTWLLNTLCVLWSRKWFLLPLKHKIE